MADLRAFRGIRYTSAAGPIGALAAPPYDVISEEQRARLAQKNARNIVHLILPQGGPERYRLASERLEAWIREGILAQERDSALYLYRQTYNGADGRNHVRTGFLGLLRLEPAGGSVRHHEQTLAKPLEDRLRLIRATRTQLSPIFVIYSDAAGNALRKIEERSTREKPGPRPYAGAIYGRRASELTPGGIMEFNDEDGVRHWMQAISDEGAIAEARRTLADQPVVIADGHHRYSAALEFRDRMQAAFPDTDPDLPENFVLACFVRAEDPGLTSLPTHRVLPGGKGGPDGAQVLAALAKRFDIQSFDIPAGTEGPVAAVPPRADQGRSVVIGARFTGDPRLHVLLLREGEEAFAGSALEPALRGLDVAVLHKLVLEPEYGIDAEALQQGGRLRYERDPRKAATQVTGGEARAAFFLRPIPTSAIFDITGHGLRLPQKSTYFAPKLASGLVLHRLGV
jgi:uncharacterized protein (DUF1015 family)